MNKRSRLNRKPKLYASLKAKTWLSVILIVIFFAIPTTLFWYGGQVDKMISLKPVYAQTPIYEYKIPTLNPNETEREQNIGLIRKIWGRDYKIGLAIAKAESGYRTHAVNKNTNGTIDEGCFQVNSVHGMPDMQISTANISYAYSLYLKQGTNPWNSSKAGWDN